MSSVASASHRRNRLFAFVRGSNHSNDVPLSDLCTYYFDSRTICVSTTTFLKQRDVQIDCSQIVPPRCKREEARGAWHQPIYAAAVTAAGDVVPWLDG